MSEKKKIKIKTFDNTKKAGLSEKSDFSVNKNKPTKIEKAVLYQQLRKQHPDWTKEKCKLLAGYSVNTTTVQIEKSLSKIGNTRSREFIVQEAKAGYQEQLEFFTGIRDDKEEQTSCRISAAREINSMVPGHLAPKQLEQRSASLIIELNKIPESDLQEFQKSFNGM